MLESDKYFSPNQLFDVFDSGDMDEGPYFTGTREECKEWLFDHYRAHSGEFSIELSDEEPEMEFELPPRLKRFFKDHSALCNGQGNLLDAYNKGFVSRDTLDFMRKCLFLPISINLLENKTK